MAGYDDEIVSAFLRNERAIKRSFQTVTGSPADSEDLAQEAWTKLERNGSAALAAPVPYLFRIVRSLAIDHQRRRSRLSAAERHALNGALTFAAFMSFWGAYAFYLERAHAYGPGVAGAFGAAGLVGAAAASFAGRAVDRGAYRPTVTKASLLISGGFLAAALADWSLGFMVIGLLRSMQVQV